MPAADVSSNNSQLARDALERVCSGNHLDDVGDYYHERFVDHVNSREYHGLDGARRSVGLYMKLFDDLKFEVVDQVQDAESVASRWVLTGTHRGRRVRLNGIVISRIDEGRIIEDHAISDSFELVKQLGVWRTLRLLVTQPGLLKG